MELIAPGTSVYDNKRNNVIVAYRSEFFKTSLHHPFSALWLPLRFPRLTNQLCQQVDELTRKQQKAHLLKSRV